MGKRVMEYSTLRKAGVLAPFSSLPSPYGIGGCGQDTFAFIDLIKDTGFSFWQVLPLCPLGYGSSPYSSISAFAGNELYIDIDALKDDGLLEETDTMPFYVDRSRVNYEWVKEYKMPLLKKAAMSFLKETEENDELLKSFNAFKRENKYWLSDYALFRTLGEKYGTYDWNHSWDKELMLRDKKAIRKAEKLYKNDIALWEALQFIFTSQWNKIKSYANEKGVKIIGDLPFCSIKDSAEVWAHPELFMMSKGLKQTKSIGVPPDAYSTTGQLWGNPSYRWKAHRAENFKFWKERVKAQLRFFDYLRLDHFRGFASTWNVKASDKTAENGKWVKTPGEELLLSIFNGLKIKQDNIPFIAEDLGVITKDVDALREEFCLPSLRVMEFGFAHGEDDPHLPHMWDENVFATLGTHDNNTLIGWWQDSATESERDRAKRYFYSNDESTPWYMIRSLLASRAPVVMIAYQDLCFLPSFARFNTPGTVSDKNWTYRITDVFDRDKFRYLLSLYSRL